MTGVRLPPGYRHAHFEEIDSTNEEAKRLALAGERGPVWLSATRQTAGRGRRGRDWISPPGNLMATLLLAPGRPAGEAALLSFVAALAVHDAVGSWVQPDDVKVKWPNDTLVRGRKIAGILLETSGPADSGDLSWLAVGIGINLVYAPEMANYPATCVNDHGRAPDTFEALSVLAMHWTRRFQEWQSAGFSATREAWLQVAAGLGERIEVRLPQETMTGVFESLGGDGALQLRLDSGALRSVTAGEVFFAATQG